jgi:hypothetical protein
MGRLSELAILLLLVWLFFPSLTRTFRRALGLREPAPRPPQAPAASSEAEPLVRCARCGVFVARMRAVPASDGDQALFCSERCRKLNQLGTH